MGLANKLIRTNRIDTAIDLALACEFASIAEFATVSKLIPTSPTKLRAGVFPDTSWR
jgi:hypothetical protein